MSFKRREPVWVKDPVKIAAMLNDPAVRVNRDDFISEIQLDGQPVKVNCRMYWTPTPGEIVHPGVAPVAPEEPERPEPIPVLREEDWRDVESVESTESWFVALQAFKTEHKEWREILMPAFREHLDAYETQLARFEMEIKVGEPAPENDGPPARFLVPGSGPSTILTHGRGSNLDVPAIVGFNQGFGRTHSSLAFARGKENEAERAAVFNALAANYPTNTFTGRSFGARAATIAALKNPAINQLICFTIPIVRERDTSLSEDLLKLPATTDVLFVLGNDDARTPEIELHRVRKLMKARTWWIRVILGDHGLFYLPESKRVALAKVMGQLAAQWCENRDPAKTEFVLDWVEDKEKGLNQPVWSEWQPIQEDPAEGWGCAVQ